MPNAFHKFDPAADVESLIQLMPDVKQNVTSGGSAIDVIQRMASRSYDRLSVEINDMLKADWSAHDEAVRALADQFQSISATSKSLAGDFGRMLRGRIIIALPYVNWYHVMLADGGGTLPCVKLSSDSSLGPLGSREISPLMPDTMVCIYLPPGGTLGYITGSIPYQNSDVYNSLPDFVSQGGLTGFTREAYMRDLPRVLKKGGFIRDFSSGRPLDATAGGEWGRITELGGGFFLDPFMAYMRMDEATGLFLFYHDQAVRLTGRNLELWAAGYEFNAYDANGELSVVQGYTPYPWEALGGAAPNSTNEAAVVTPTSELPKGAYRTVLEPLVDEYGPREPQWRTLHYFGYAGQGGRRQVVVPLSSGGGGLGGSGPLEGMVQTVFDECVHLDGTYSLTSAKQILIAKRLGVVGRRLKTGRFNAPSTAEYKAAGAFNKQLDGSQGTGVDHKVGAIEANEEEDAHVAKAAAAADVQAYTRHFKDQHPQFYAEADGMSEWTTQAKVSFAELGERQHLAPAEADTVQVDHRQTTKLYPSNAYLLMLDDGGVLLGDGYGAEIRMTGGSIYIDAPGDIVFRSGRNVVGLAGDDLNLRANNSVDVSAAHKDVRLKAEANMQLLAGNGGAGGILIESKGIGDTQDYDGKVGEDVVSSGIVLKSPQSPLIAWGAGVYLRTGSATNGIGSGPIVFDADKGQADIRTVSSRFDRFLGSTAVDTFGIDNPQAVNSYSASVTDLGSNQLHTAGFTILNYDGAGTGLLVNGGINVLGGHIGTENAKQFDYKTGELKGRSLALNVVSRVGAASRHATAVSNAETAYQEQVEEAFYADGKPGNDELQQQAAFSFRDERQYGTTNFTMAEARWQQMLREYDDGGGQTWSEPAVKYQSTELRPYPGSAKWADEDTWRELPAKFYDHAAGEAVDRGVPGNSIYEEPILEDWEPVKPDGNYRVINGN